MAGQLETGPWYRVDKLGGINAFVEYPEQAETRAIDPLDSLTSRIEFQSDTDRKLFRDTAEYLTKLFMHGGCIIGTQLGGTSGTSAKDLTEYRDTVSYLLEMTNQKQPVLSSVKVTAVRGKLPSDNPLVTAVNGFPATTSIYFLERSFVGNMQLGEFGISNPPNRDFYNILTITAKLAEERLTALGPIQPTIHAKELVRFCMLTAKVRNMRNYQVRRS